MNTTFKKLVAGALVAATLVGTVAVSSESASAQGWRYRRGGWGGPLAAGIIGGLALGAIAGAATAPYYGPGYGPGPYGPGYGPDPGCYYRRGPIYDQWGNFAGYGPVAVCP
ncbi:MAG: hypothetical protein JO163_10395 [Methylobacteriaceae bacterium]|nr:hypothetical protein [Methylobacteriaceae bacterium]MBV9703128.1 hypothetical protein [Methylobacteriaceae bacterium]